MTPADLPLPLREALALHQLYLRIGFLAEQIFLAAAATEAQVVLRADGQEFVVGLGPRLSAAEVLRQWPAVVRALKEDFTDDQIGELTDSSEIAGRLAELRIGLNAKGIRLPDPHFHNIPAETARAARANPQLLAALEQTNQRIATHYGRRRKERS